MKELRLREVEQLVKSTLQISDSEGSKPTPEPASGSLENGRRTDLLF